MLGCGKGPEGGNGTHREEQKALRMLGFLDTCSFQPLEVPGDPGRAGGCWVSQGVCWEQQWEQEPGGRGTSLAVPWEGHQEPAFLGDTAARREDPDF